MGQDPKNQGEKAPHQDMHGDDSSHQTRVEEVMVDPATQENTDMIVTEATLETKLPNGQTIETEVVPKKKKRTGLLVIIVILVLLILGGIGFAVWYCAIYNNPEKVAFDAVHGLIESKNLTVSGVMSGTTTIDGQEAQVTIKLSSAAEGNSGNSTLIIEITPVDANGEVSGDKMFSLKIGDVIMADQTIYVKIDDLLDAYNNIVMPNIEQYDEGTALVAGIAEQIVETIDGKWWRISIPELIDEILGDSDYQDPAQELFTCMTNVSNQDVKGELAQLYSNYRFINIAKEDTPEVHYDNTSTYNVDLDYDKAADFINSLSDTEIANRTYNCINKFMDSINSRSGNISSSDIKSINASDLEDYFDNANIKMEITNFEHKLVSMTITSANPDNDKRLSLDFGYESVEVVAPEDYRSLTELTDDLADIIMNIIMQQINGSLEYDAETGEWIIVGTGDTDWSMDDDNNYSDYDDEYDYELIFN